VSLNTFRMMAFVAVEILVIISRQAQCSSTGASKICLNRIGLPAPRPQTIN
jgi:hypothetical protein